MEESQKQSKIVFTLVLFQKQKQRLKQVKNVGLFHHLFMICILNVYT